MKEKQPAGQTHLFLLDVFTLKQADFKYLLLCHFVTPFSLFITKCQLSAYWHGLC